MKLYLSMKKILGQSGFGWDSALKKVNANGEVWSDYVKVSI